MEETINERLIAFIKSKKISVRKFERDCGLANGYVNGIKYSILPDKMRNIIRQFPELNPGWLLTGEGEMLKRVNTTTVNSGIMVGGDVGENNNILHFQGEKIDFNNISKDKSTKIIYELQAELQHLKSILDEKNKLLNEKERLIQILLEKTSS